MIEKGYYKRNNGSEAILEVIGTHESGDPLCSWLFNTGGNGFRYHAYEFGNEFVPVAKEEVEKLERQRCGRRGESVASLEKELLPDYWRQLPNGDRTCSFCGSLHPDSVIEIIKQHGFGVIHKSDKNYKWYISRPSVENGLRGGIKYYRQHDTDDFIKNYNQLVG